MDALDFSDLSEDWIEQARSSDPPEVKDDIDVAASTKSKIPVPARRSVSGPNSILQQKSASDINSDTASRQASQDLPPEAFSGTVAHREGEIVAVKGTTPEWKKKLLHGKGKSEDLFSPCGLQSVFRPPTIKNQTPYPKRQQKLASPSGIMPSSPPMLPNSADQSILIASEDSIQLPPIRAPSVTRPQAGERRRTQSGVSSNKSMIHNERFSPITIGQKKPSVSLRMSSKLNSRNPSQETRKSPSSMSDSVLMKPAARGSDDSGSMSLPDYAELDSQNFSLDPKFITTKRGGFSREGSFRHRPLTPSSYQPGIQSSLLPSDMPVAPEPPMTPSGKKGLSLVKEESPQRQRSSGSPLKLFNNYDTFTNERLNRRISQFALNKDSTEQASDNVEPPTPSPRKAQALRRKQRMSSFGDGHLDRYDFTHVNSDGVVPQWPVKNSLERPTELQQDSEDPFEDEEEEVRPTSSHTPKHEPMGFLQNLDIKRAPDSPTRDPDPKRRRVLSGGHDSDDADINVRRQRPHLRSSSSMAGQKRKDARHGDSNALADPATLAGRDILDPKSPFRKLSRAFSKMLEEDDNKEQFIDVDVATGVLADELASLALNVAEDVTSGVRKKSVTTADFFREANIIMQHIRSKAAQGGRQSSKPDAAAVPKIKPSARHDELFSNDDLDRPASREGGSPPRKRNITMDKRVVSQLRKFADNDELGLALNSSFDAMKLQEYTQQEDMDSFQSDRSDIRILNPLPAQNTEEDYGTGKTNSSNKTNSSQPTTSSGTRSRATIEPHKVSHLLTDTMGGMTFDHDRQCWVKRKSIEAEAKRTSRLGSEMTEDDPFADIPDLEDHLAHSTPPSPAKSQYSTRPTTADTNTGDALASSQPANDTRATSWSTTQPLKRTMSAQDRQREQAIEAALLRDGTAAQSHAPAQQARAVTVAFSSPPARSYTPEPYNDDEGFIESVETPNERDWDVEAERIRTKNNLSSSVVKYTQRPLSRIEELESSFESVSNGAVKADLSLQVRTPAGKINNALAVPTTNQSYVPMQLTPLPDFTVNQVDQSLNLDVQYVARKQGLVGHGQIEDRFSVSIKELVNKIANIEPYEPYWEHLRELSLSKNGLFTLHMLDEFCPCLETLQVDDNELGQLNGAPRMIRNLSIGNNCLSDLTSWGHLYNLQYLDISGNDLTSLKGIGDLVHLRELKADNNKIRDLDGILYLDGLLKLSVARNSVDKVDFKDSKLFRLEELNLAHNDVIHVAGLEALSSLQRLDLRSNKLASLEFDPDEQHKSLVCLNLANNQLTALEVSSLHGLRDLIVDFNSIKTIINLEVRRNIQRVSWRYQRFESSTVKSHEAVIDYSCAVETRSLNISGNRLLTFDLSEKFLNLEKLDLASCGIKKLDSDFGRRVPNIRRLNLNHNAIRDLSSLAGIKKLSHLYLVNNRLKDFREAVKLLGTIGQRLEVLDCRGNLFNVGYYTPQKEDKLLRASVSSITSRSEKDPFNDSTFLIPDANSRKDEEFLASIDFGTSIRRRVYELMLTQNCQQLAKLDGITIDKARIETEDKIWNRLMALGIVKARNRPSVDEARV